MPLILLAPELVLVVFAAGIVLLDLGLTQKRLLPMLAILGLITSADLTLGLRGVDAVAFGGALVVDSFSVGFKLLLLGSTILVVLASTQYEHRLSSLRGEYYGLLLFSCAGMMVLSSSADLITIYISLELTGISLYCLSGLLKDSRSTEAGIKFLLLGAVSSAVVLYGMVIFLGLTGTTNIQQMGPALAQGFQVNRLPILLGIVLLISGFGFKMATVPFQMWVPDVYEGAPTPVTAFLSVASKAAGFAVVLRLFHSMLGFGPLTADWSWIFALLSAITMTVGNVVAIQQQNIKRMMGYSSIAQAGYLLVGLAVVPIAGPSGVLFFLVSYALTNLGAFIAITAISDQLNSDQIKDYTGVLQRSPFLGGCLVLCLLSLTGIPPTAGFFAKLFIFGAGVQQGLAWLVLLGVVNSVISAYYYIGVVKEMVIGAPREHTPLVATPALAIALIIAAAGTFLLGILPGPAMDAATAAASSLMP